MAGNGLIWKVAIGVFVGAAASLVATCGVLAVGGAAVMEQQDRQKAAVIQNWLDESNSMVNESNRQFAQNNRRLDQARQAQEEQKKVSVELSPDERCVGKTRLRRIENGWMQSGSCP